MNENWWDALDYLTGAGSVKQDVARGLQMARESPHPQAEWLVALFPREERVTPERVRDVMLQQGDEPFALYLAACVAERDPAVMRRAANLGCAAAQSYMGSGKISESIVLQVQWAERAAARRERNALFSLGDLLRWG